MTDRNIDAYLETCFDRPWHIVGAIHRDDGPWGTCVYEIADEKGRACALKCVPAPIKKRREVRSKAETMKKLCDADGLVHLEECALMEDGDVCALLIRMEKYVSLAQILEAGRVDQKLAGAVTRDLMRGLCACHATGMAHGHVKPQNIFRDQKGRFLLGDFGIFRAMTPDGSLTAASGRGCSPLYAPPEVILGGEVNWFRVDVYAAGLLMYQLYNGGILPFSPCDEEEMIQRRCSQREIPAPAQADEAVEAVIDRALMFDPGERYADARDMACGLGMCYLGGDEGDYFRAPEFFRIAAEGGSAEAQFNLGYCLSEGIGAGPDAAEAMKWFERAAAQGHAGARNYLSPDEKLRDAFDCEPMDGGRAMRVTRCKRVEAGAVRFPETADGLPVAALGAYLFVDEYPESDSTDHKPALYTQTREDVLRVELPRHLREIHPRAFYGCTALKEIVLAEGNVNFRMIGNLLYTSDGKTLVKCPAAAESIHIPEGTEVIADGALFGCAALRAVEVPASARVIGRMAFCGCASLEALELPEGVKEIGTEAFTFCESLRQISFPASVTKVGEHILSWRYGTKPVCVKDSLMAMYVTEHCPYDPEDAGSEEAGQEIGNVLMTAMMLLMVSYERHPDGVPRQSGSYGLIMKARGLLRAAGGRDAEALALQIFASKYPQHLEELRAYWDQ